MSPSCTFSLNDLSIAQTKENAPNPALTVARRLPRFSPSTVADRVRNCDNFWVEFSAVKFLTQFMAPAAHDGRDCAEFRVSSTENGQRPWAGQGRSCSGIWSRYWCVHRIHSAPIKASGKVCGNRTQSPVCGSLQSAIPEGRAVSGHGRECKKHLRSRWNAIGGLHYFWAAVGCVPGVGASEVSR